MSITNQIFQYFFKSQRNNFQHHCQMQKRISIFRASSERSCEVTFCLVYSLVSFQPSIFSYFIFSNIAPKQSLNLPELNWRHLSLTWLTLAEKDNLKNTCHIRRGSIIIWNTVEWHFNWQNQVCGAENTTGPDLGSKAINNAERI